MTARGYFMCALLLALGAAGTWMWFGQARAPSATAGRLATPAAAQKQAVPPTDPNRVSSSVAAGTPLVRTAPAPADPVPPSLPATSSQPASRPEPQAEGRAELEKVRFMVRDFRTRMGENPVGSNAEIMRAVMGGNSAGARLGPPEGQALNADGELVDRWGTPYFFHQLSKDSMEIRSAGPDHRMGTSDDLVTK